MDSSLDLFGIVGGSRLTLLARCSTLTDSRGGRKTVAGIASRGCIIQCRSKRQIMQYCRV
jgi:hypothetical protein